MKITSRARQHIMNWMKARFIWCGITTNVSFAGDVLPSGKSAERRSDRTEQQRICHVYRLSVRDGTGRYKLRRLRTVYRGMSDGRALRKEHIDDVLAAIADETKHV